MDAAEAKGRRTFAEVVGSSRRQVAIPSETKEDVYDPGETRTASRSSWP